MSVYSGPNVIKDNVVFKYDTFNVKSLQGQPTTNLISSSGLDASVLGSYTLLNVTRVEDSESFSGWAMQQQIQSNTINGASRAAFGTASSIPTSGSAFVSVYAKQTAGTANITPSVYTGGGWFTLAPLDGGPTRLTSAYRRFGVACTLSTASGGPNPAFSMTNSGTTTDTSAITRWHSPQIELTSVATPFVAGTRSNTQALLDLTGNATITANSLTYSGNNISFNGTSNFISIANSINMRPLTELTIECVIRPTATTSGWRQIIGYGQGDYTNGNYLVFAESNSGPVRALARVNNAEVRCNTNFDAPINQFSYVTFTMRTGDAIRSYFNGVAGTTAALAAGTFTYNGTTSPYQVGSPGSGWYTGNIPFIKLYNRALTATEVLQNYNALRLRFGL